VIFYLAVLMIAAEVVMHGVGSAVVERIRP
jgi:hypothetical protein